jgi:hypothetical protein
MKQKTAIIRESLESGNERKALSVAAKFFDRSAETQLFKRAQSAINNPSLYRQMGHNPDAIFADAIAAMRAKFC